MMCIIWTFFMCIKIESNISPKGVHSIKGIVNVWKHFLLIAVCDLPARFGKKDHLVICTAKDGLIIDQQFKTS